MAAQTYDFTPKIQKTDEDSTTRLKEYYRRIGSWCDQAYEEASAEQREIPEVQGIQNALDYLVGLQWKESLPSYRAKPVSNELLSNFWETIGLLTDIKPIFHVKQITNDDAYSKTASILNHGAKAWAKQTAFTQKMAFWTMFAMMTTAPIKLYWDLNARGDSGDPSDADISMEVLSTTSLLRLGKNGGDLQNDECTIYRKRRTLAWIKRAFPRMGQYVTPDMNGPRYTANLAAPPTVMPQLFESLSGGMKRVMGGSEKSSGISIYPTAEVREYWMKDDTVNQSSNTVWVGPKGAAWGYWVKPGQKLYPRGRIIVRANGITLYDEPNPYFHRMKPFVQMGLYAVPWQEYALSVMKPWMSQQDILNQMMSGLIQCVKKAINPPLMAPKSAIHPDALRQIDASKPNLKISYNSNAATPPAWGNPPNVPSYVFNVYSEVRRSMRQQSGTDAMSDALGKRQVPGGDTLDRITFSKTTPIRQMGGNIETAVNELGQLWTGTFLQFYDAAKRVELMGTSALTVEDIDNQPGTLIPDGQNNESFVRKFRFECERGSLLTIQRQDKVTVAFALRKNRDLSRKKLFQTLDWNINQDENDKELQQEQIELAKAVMAAKGGQQ